MVRQHVVGYHWLEESVVVVHLISIIDDRAGYNENAAAVVVSKVNESLRSCVNFRGQGDTQSSELFLYNKST